VKKKIGILLISNGIGGAEKRFINFFNYLDQNTTENVTLIINENLHRCLPTGQIKNMKNVIILKESKISFFFFKIRKYNILFQKMHTLLQRINLSYVIMKFIRKNKFTLIHGLLEGVRYFSLLKFLDKKLLLISSIVGTVHGGLNKPQIIRGLKKSNHIDCLNANVHDKVVKIVGETYNTKSTTPNTFTDYTRFKPSKKKQKKVVFCARMDPVKNPMLFVEMARSVTQKINDPEVEFIMIGNGILFQEVSERVNQVRKEGVNIHCTGYLSNPSQILKDALIFVQPTSTESHATQSILEAMGNACAVITTNLPGVEMTVPEGCGLTCDLKHEAFSEKVIELLNNINNTIQIGNKAKEYVNSNFTVEKFSDYLLNIYNKIK